MKSSRSNATKLLIGFFSIALVCIPPLQGQNAHFFRISGPASTRFTTVNANGIVLWTNGQAGALYTFQTSTMIEEVTNWVDYVNATGTTGLNSNRLFDLKPPMDMAFIPAGPFTMGDSLDGDTQALPLHTVYVSALYMDQYDVTKALWDAVYHWAITNGYSFDTAGLADGLGHPVKLVNWYDSVKWCNARSEMAGRTPAYFTDPGQHSPYRTGHVEPYVNWNSGYRCRQKPSGKKPLAAA